MMNEIRSKVGYLQLIHSTFLFLSILADFVSGQWNQVTNESIRTQMKSRQAWFNPRETIKNVHARLNVWIPQSKYASP